MVKETEIKLRVTPQTLEALRLHPLLLERMQGDWQSGVLYNQYYDSADRKLAAARVALRVRRDGEDFIQTLKSRGQSVAGLSERNEWDWPTASAALDLNLLDDSCWPASLADLDRSTLQPIFTTDFERTKVMLCWQRGEAKVEVEAALDHGQVIAGDHQEPICELELELRAGPAVAILELAAALAADLPLMPCDISKAERGYRLFDPASYDLRLDAQSLAADTCVDTVIASAGWQLLGYSQRLAEQYRFNGQWKLFRELTTQLTSLRAMFGVFDLALPRSSAQPYTALLDQLLDQYRPLVLAGWTDDDEGVAARAQAQEVFAQTSSDPRWGQLFIGLALWLFETGWKSSRHPRGERIGALSLPKWLLAAVAKEVQELRVPHHNDADSEVHGWLDQLPRLSRLYFMLSTFRQHLDVPEADRLFGELNKLQQLLEQYPQVDAGLRPALLTALRKQGQRLRKLNAWRELNG